MKISNRKFCIRKLFFPHVKIKNFVTTQPYREGEVNRIKTNNKDVTVTNTADVMHTFHRRLCTCRRIIIAYHRALGSLLVQLSSNAHRRTNAPWRLCTKIVYMSQSGGSRRKKQTNYKVSHKTAPYINYHIFQIFHVKYVKMFLNK